MITLIQEDNLFGTDASLTYGPQFTNVDICYIPSAFMHQSFVSPAPLGPGILGT